MQLKDYQIEIINKALSYLQCDYDSHDLEELMYSGLELESEITILKEKLETRLVELYKQGNAVE